MDTIRRQIIRIDEDRCDGCGACVPACKEGALHIVDGKARLVSEIYCDGLGTCLGKCPKGALTIEECETKAFDEAAAGEHRASSDHASRTTCHDDLPCGCPGMMAREINRKGKAEVEVEKSKRAEAIDSELKQWPIQLALIPVTAPYLKHADLVLLADCSAVAYANLHRDVVKDRVIAMACPKLDETESYIEKLAHMMRINAFNSITVVMMEVPCCGGLAWIVEEARARACVDIGIRKSIISIDGDVLVGEI